LNRKEDKHKTQDFSCSLLRSFWRSFSPERDDEHEREVEEAAEYVTAA